VDGAITTDGRRVLLLLAEPDGAARDATRWHLIEVGVSEGTKRDTEIGGVVPVPVGRVRADFADDSGSFVVWDDNGRVLAMLVQVADGRQTPIAAHPRPAESVGFRALPAGVAQLWDDGAITLVDRSGTTVQELDVPQEPVRDIAISPDGRWAVTAGDGGDVFRWDVEPSTGGWSGRERMACHTGDVLGAEVDPAGRRLVTVSVDHTVITWDPSSDGDAVRRGFADAAARLDAACAIVGRDFTRAEWRRFLPERPWQRTCTDLA
jgi:WD40 repeat protein